MDAPIIYLAERLTTARKMAGLSLQELADKMDNRISKQAIHQFEQGKSKPEADTLLDLAKALNVRLDFFFRDNHVQFDKLEYRKKVKLSKTEATAINETAKDWFARYFELEELMDAHISFENPLTGILIRNEEDLEKAADSLREKWELGTKPIPSVIEMLEQKGIKVLEVNATDGFQGFSAEANGRLVVVLNANDDAFRKRFTALHELAHIVLGFAEGLDVERYCHRFAGAVLFPKQSVIEVFSSKRKKLAFAELLQQKCYYGISVQAILKRLRDLEVINEATYKGFLIWMNKVGYRSKEPGRYAGLEQPLRFSQLLYRAAIEEVISLSKAASLMNLSLSEFRKTLVKPPFPMQP
ncbi:MAG: helix-turn-helix domain-containing protein [Runella zeae]